MAELDPFGALNQNLQQLIARNLNPQFQLAAMKQKEQEAKSNVIGSLIANFDPEKGDILELTKDIAAVDDRFIAPFVGMVKSNVDRKRKLEMEELKLKTLEESLAEFPKTARAAKAGAPTGLLTDIFEHETKVPEPPEGPEGVPAGWPDKFTGESINKWKASGSTEAERDYSLLEYSPEFLERHRKDGGDKVTPTTLTKEQRKLRSETLATKIESHPFYKTFGEVGFLGAFGKGTDPSELAQGLIEDDPETKKILQNAPDNMKSLIVDYTFNEFGADVFDKVFSRGQSRTPSSDLIDEASSVSSEVRNAAKKLLANRFGDVNEEMIKLFLEQNEDKDILEAAAGVQ